MAHQKVAGVLIGITMIIACFSAVFTKSIKCFIKRGYNPITLRRMLGSNSFAVGCCTLLFWLRLTDYDGQFLKPLDWIVLIFVSFLASFGPFVLLFCCSAFLKRKEFSVIVFFFALPSLKAQSFLLLSLNCSFCTCLHDHVCV
jgi:hypothetical protein